jgi:hypothetical protein
LADEIAQNYFTYERPFYAWGGALLGLILGPLMGAEAGLGLLLYRRLASRGGPKSKKGPAVPDPWGNP